ncbi:MAG TPA: hypothetical protein VGO89_11825 [Streptomyces sp.]|nr:hypothetical protein [Streptomyces sp.]
MLQQQPQSRASRLPLIALACTVVLAVALPLAAATAGPAGSSAEGKARVASASSAPSAPSGGGAEGDLGSDTAQGASRRSVGDTGVSADAGPVAACGGELTSPEGLTAQTCVMSQRRERWARTYYRNATNSPLRAALTLARPDGSSLRADCAVPAGEGRPGMCETPREKGRAGGAAPRYAATTEFGSPDGERLLLRSGSNSPTQ